MNVLLCRLVGLIVMTALLSHCQTTSSPSDNPDKRGVRSEGESRDFKRAYQKGRKDAEQDVKKGIFALEVYGMPPPPGREAPRPPGVQMRSVAGCVVDDQILGHAKGYNEVSHPAIQQKFGPLHPPGSNQKGN